MATTLGYQPAARHSWFRLPGRSVRLRLTLLYGGMFLLSGFGLLALTFWIEPRIVRRTPTAKIRPPVTLSPSCLSSALISCSVPSWVFRVHFQVPVALPFSSAAALTATMVNIIAADRTVTQTVFLAFTEALPRWRRPNGQV